MSWAPNDLITDKDLTDYEGSILTQFGTVSHQAKRQRALSDWLLPAMVQAGYPVDRFRTRYAPDQAFTSISGTFADVTTAVADDTEDDLNLATTFATPGTDALYLGSERPFRGLSWRLLDDVSIVAGTVTVAYWADTWEALAVSNGTASAGVPWTRGGAMTWTLPTDWVVRAVNDSSRRYWVRLTVSATPTAGTTVSQIGCIRRSVFAAPAVLRTLALIFREAPTGGDGPWIDKAEYYEREADAALIRALAAGGGEFDTITVDDVVDADEAVQTASAVGAHGFRLERY